MIKLYEWNQDISAAFYVALQTVEVAFRNACARELANRFGSAWYNDSTLQRLDLSIHKTITLTISDISPSIKKLGRGISPSDIIAALPFGFWTRLLSKRFDRELWVPALKNAFPRYKQVVGHNPSRPIVAQRFDYIRGFRNRVAHHEPIFKRALHTDYNSLLEVASWMYVDVGSWIEASSICHSLLSQYDVKLGSKRNA
jgi:hypothetical protein